MASIQPLKMATYVTGGVATVVVAGELDVYSTPRLRQAVHEARRGQPGRIVVDMAAVSFIDVRGLETLVDLVRESRQLGMGFVVRHPTEQLQHMRRLIGLEDSELPVEAA